MTTRPWLGALTIIGCALLAACGGGGGGAKTATLTTGGSGTGTSTASDFDLNKLTAIVLRPEEAPAGLEPAGFFSPGGQDVTSFTTLYGGQSLYVQSTVGRFADPTTQDDRFQHIRRGFAVLQGGEQNYDLPGSDRAYSYTSDNPPSIATLGIKNDYFAVIVLRSADKTRTEEATDQATLRNYTNIVWARLANLIAAPDSVTPIPNAPKFGATVEPPAGSTPAAPPATPPALVTP